MYPNIPCPLEGLATQDQPVAGMIQNPKDTVYMDIQMLNWDFFGVLHVGAMKKLGESENVL